MKKIGEYTTRGLVTETQVIDGRPAKIPLFDGSFETAYKVTAFYVWGTDWSAASGPDVIGKLSKNDDGTVGQADFMRADDGNQIAWAGSSGGADTPGVVFNNFIIDPENLVVEDLYVYARSTNATQSDPINYMVIMEKYEISDWKGALTMAQDRAQGDL